MTIALAKIQHLCSTHNYASFDLVLAAVQTARQSMGNVIFRASER
jgi:hypothetical protein